MCHVIYNEKYTGYTHGNTPFVIRDNTKDTMKPLRKLAKISNSNSNNQMKVNIDKCHLLLNNRGPNTTEIGNLFIKSSYEKLPGIIGIVSLITQD